MIHGLAYHLKDRQFRKAFIGAFLLFALSLVINYFAGTYATEKASSSVTDIILDNIRVYDVDGIFIYGGYLLAFSILVASLFYPRRMPFVVKSIALFYIIRSAFVMLTHIAPFPTRTIIDPLSFMRFFDFSGELFFSGHTGLPFLVALIFWDNKVLRLFFIGMSLFLAAIVLMGHLHYSIDVFSAFFITYAIYHIALQIFKKDKELDEAVAQADSALPSIE